MIRRSSKILTCLFSLFTLFLTQLFLKQRDAQVQCWQHLKPTPFSASWCFVLKTWARSLEKHFLVPEQCRSPEWVFGLRGCTVQRRSDNLFNKFVCRLGLSTLWDVELGLVLSYWSDGFLLRASTWYNHADGLCLVDTHWFTSWSLFCLQASFHNDAIILKICFMSKEWDYLGSFALMLVRQTMLLSTVENRGGCCQGTSSQFQEEPRGRPRPQIMQILV